MKRAAGDLATAAAVVGVVALLHGGLLLHLGSWQALGVFHSGHLWCFDHVTQMMTGQLPWSTLTDRVGYPAEVEVRFIAWVPALISAPLNLIFGPLTAYNLAFLASTGLGVLAMAALCRGRGAGELGARTAGVVFALSPPLIGALANGQTCKAQVWVVPAVLAALDAWIGTARPITLLVLVAVTVAGAFSEPTYALLLGLVVPVWVLLAGRGRWVRAAVGGLAIGLVFAFAARYYDVDPAISAFTPSVRLGSVGDVTQLDQQATPGALMGWEAPEWAPTGTIHVAYMGLPALLTVLLALRMRGARAAITSLAGIGIVVSLGEYLTTAGHYVHVGDQVISLPARLLAWGGYPLARSGQYYRAVLLAWTAVGLAVALLARTPARAAALGLVLVADGLRATRSAWPFAVGPVDGLATWAEMRADPRPGAILDLPLSVGNLNLGQAMLSAALADRPVQALPVFMPLRHHPIFRQHSAWIDERMPEDDPVQTRRLLQEAGYAYVVWRPVVREGGPDLAQLERSLGVPHTDGTIRWWTVEP